MTRNILFFLICTITVLLTGCGGVGSMEDKLIGTWQWESEQQTFVFTFSKDHTFTNIIAGYSNSEQTGQWRIEGDELIRVTEKSADDDDAIGERRVNIITKIENDELALQFGEEVLIFTRLGNLDNAAIHLYVAKWFEKHDKERSALRQYQTAYSLDSTNTEILMTFGSFGHDFKYTKVERILFTKLLQSDDADKYVDAIAAKLGYPPYRSEIIPEGSNMMVTDLYESKDLRVISTQDHRRHQKGNTLFVQDNRTGKRREVPFPTKAWNTLKQFAFDSHNNRIVVAMPNQGVEIYVADLESLQPRLLYTLSKKGETIVPGQIEISANGEHIVLAACSYREPGLGKRSHLDLYSVDIQGKKAEHILEVLADPIEIPKKKLTAWYYDRVTYFKTATYLATYLGFVSSEDGKKIYYLRPSKVRLPNGSYSHSLWEYDIASKKNAQPLKENFPNAFGLRLSPASGHLVFLTAGPYKKEKADGEAIHIIDLHNNALTSFNGTYRYSFINSHQMMFGTGDTVFEYDFTNGKKRTVADRMPDQAKRAIGFEKDGKAIFYKTDGPYLRVALPTEKISAKEFLEIFTAAK